MKKRFLLAFFIVFFISVIIYKYMEVSKEVAIENLANKTLETVKVANEAILDTYMVVAQKSFLDIMKNKEAMKILEEFKYASQERKNLLRGRLYRLLYTNYELLQKLSIRQLHFHTYDGKSLLRFDLPYKNGDSLIDFRTSVKMVNTNFKAVAGFEGGRNYFGYRYVFPMINQYDNLGSVEFSINFEGVEKKLQNILPFHTHMIIFEKKVVYKHIFEKKKNLFLDSSFSNKYCVENYEISKITKKVKDNKFVNKLIKLSKDSIDFNKKLCNKKSFTIPIIKDNKGYIVTFLSIKNTDKNEIGYIVSFGEFQDVVELKNRYNNFIFIGFLVAIFVYILMAIVIVQVEKIKTESSKLKKFIDIQNSIVILTDGEDFQFANKKFFDFFGYKDLKEFLKDHHCICEEFINIDGFFSLKDVKANEDNWIESLLNLSGRKRIISMVAENSMTYAFSVSINKYDEKNYVVNFTDISDTLKEKLHLQEQVIRDQLTKAYNRVYFDKNINSLIEFHTNNEQRTGIIFFDIDHFKDVNDTYGHQVGDNVLKTIVNIVKSNIRSGDKLIRWGGEEFIIILSADKIDDIYRRAEHIRVKIEHHKFHKIEQLTCSFGIVLHDSKDDVYESIKNADENLYKAKNSGRNKVIL